MKERHKAALLAIAALAAILFLGIYFSPNTTVTQAPSSASHPANTITTPTQIVSYVASVASDTPTEAGSCWTHSIAAPWREEAWRCTVDNSISDPCFEIPMSGDLLCGMNPERPSSTGAFVLKLTEPLPGEKFVPNGAINSAWLVELEDGTLCTPFTGTRPFTASGDSANYDCAPGPLGAEAMIFGDLDSSRPVWTATVGSLTISTSSLPTLENTRQINVKTIWQ